MYVSLSMNMFSWHLNWINSLLAFTACSYLWCFDDNVLIWRKWLSHESIIGSTNQSHMAVNPRTVNEV